MKHLLTLLAVLLALSTAHAEIYKWTDSSGNVVFGDTPPENVDAQPVKVQRTQTFETQGESDFKSSMTEREEKEAAEKARADKYTKLVIASPQDDEPVRSNAGNISIQFASSPELNKEAGDRFQLVMDGTPVMTTDKGTVILTNVDRGTHTLQVNIIAGDSGNVIKSSSPSTFHMLRFAGGG
jgi:hypothetical protein